MKPVGKRKITVGHVIQYFDNDNKCTAQEFIAGDIVDYEDHNGNRIDEWNECHPFGMIQSTDMTVALVGNLSEGYGAVGPFADFDEACAWAEGQDSWIITMQNPNEVFDSVKVKRDHVRTTE